MTIDLSVSEDKIIHKASLTVCIEPNVIIIISDYHFKKNPNLQ